jgi:hypothetical protein
MRGQPQSQGAKRLRKHMTAASNLTSFHSMILRIQNNTSFNPTQMFLPISNDGRILYFKEQHLGHPRLSCAHPNVWILKVVLRTKCQEKRVAMHVE